MRGEAISYNIALISIICIVVIVVVVEVLVVVVVVAEVGVPHKCSRTFIRGFVRTGKIPDLGSEVRIRTDFKKNSDFRVRNVFFSRIRTSESREKFEKTKTTKHWFSTFPRHTDVVKPIFL